MPESCASTLSAPPARWSRSADGSRTTGRVTPAATAHRPATTGGGLAWVAQRTAPIADQPRPPDRPIARALPAITLNSHRCRSNPGAGDDHARQGARGEPPPTIAPSTRRPDETPPPRRRECDRRRNDRRHEELQHRQAPRPNAHAVRRAGRTVPARARRGRRPCLARPEATSAPAIAIQRRRQIDHRLPSLRLRARQSSSRCSSSAISLASGGCDSNSDATRAT